jgi:hypothetical protein
MKRKRILLENTSQSKILFFSNKTKIVETITMEIKATKIFKVGDKEYSSREEAITAAAMDTLHTEIPLGIDNVIAKSAEIIKALQVVGKKK